MEASRKIELRDLKKKFRSLEKTWFVLKERGKLLRIIKLELFVPKLKVYDFYFVVQFLKGEKDVIF
jgi:hypothetical protein